MGAFALLYSPAEIQTYWDEAMINPEVQVKKELEASEVENEKLEKVLEMARKDMSAAELEQELQALERELKEDGVENAAVIVGFTRELAITEVAKKSQEDEDDVAAVSTDEDEDDFVDDEDRPVAGSKYKKVVQENETLHAELMDKDRELDQLRERLASTDEILNGKIQAIWRLQKEVKLAKEAEDAATEKLDKLIQEHHKGTKISKTIRKQREQELFEKGKKTPKGPTGIQKSLNTSFEDTFRRLQSLDQQILDFGEKQKEKRRHTTYVQQTVAGQRPGGAAAAAAAAHKRQTSEPLSGDGFSSESSEDIWSGSDDSVEL